MNGRFPRLDGSSTNLDRTLDPHMRDGRASKPLHTDFDREQLPWWLSYATDNGPGSPTFDGLASNNGNSDVTIETGTTSSGDDTSLQGPTVTWSNWSEIQLFAYGVTNNDPNNAVVQVALADDQSDQDMTEGFRLQAHALAGEYVRHHIMSGGSFTGQSSGVITNVSQRMTLGFRLVDNGNGYDMISSENGRHVNRFAESQSDWPADQQLTPFVSVRSADATSSRSATIGGVYLNLIP